MADEVKRCVESCREWYQAFSNMGKGNEPSVKELLTTADMIESIAAELERVKRERDAAELERVKRERDAAELEQVKRERDAAVEDLSVSRVCRICDHYGDADFISRYCSDCVSHYKWQWRGTKEG